MPARLTPAQPIPDPGGAEVVQPAGPGESQASTAKGRQRALTARLMEQVTEPANLNRAYARVMANKGSPGVDGMTVGQLGGWIKRHKQELIASLLDGSYRPSPVRGVRIPKPGRRNRGVSIEQVIGEINEFTVGWVTFFRHAACKGHLQRLDEWVRRKLRCLRLKQCKRAKPTADFLHRLGVPKRRAWIGALSGKGWWRLSGSPPATEGMSLAWFDSLGLVSLAQRYGQLNR